MAENEKKKESIQDLLPHPVFQAGAYDDAIEAWSAGLMEKRTLSPPPPEQEKPEPVASKKETLEEFVRKERLHEEVNDLRDSDPYYEETVSKLRNWALDNLTPGEIAVLDQTPEVFLREYHRARKEAGYPGAEDEVSDYVREKILQSKEMIPERHPAPPPEETERQSNQKRLRELQEKIYSGEATRAEEDLAADLFLKLNKITFPWEEK